MTRRITLLLALSLAAGACTVGARAPNTPAYLTELEPVARQVNATIARMRVAVDQPLESDELFVNAVVDVRLGRQMAVARDRLRKIEPPPTFADDHDRYLDTIGRLQQIAAAIDGALVDPADRRSAAIAAIGLEAAAAFGFTTLSPQMCRFTAFDLRLCAPVDFFTAAETTAHSALMAAAIIVRSFSHIPASIGAAETPEVADAISDTVGAQLTASAQAVTAADPADDRLQALGSDLERMAREIESLTTDRFTRSGLNLLLVEIRSSICDLAPAFPPPDPLPAQGGGTVQIDGFAEVWFGYGGGCER